MGWLIRFAKLYLIFKLIAFTLPLILFINMFWEYIVVMMQ